MSLDQICEAGHVERAVTESVRRGRPPGDYDGNSKAVVAFWEAPWSEAWGKDFSVPYPSKRSGGADEDRQPATTIYDIENGARPWASAETMGRLARALGVTIEELREPERVA